MFYTDGATDLPAPYALDEEQLSGIIARATASSASAEDIADRIHEALDSVLSFDRRDDDIALLVLRITDHAIIEP